ncbi:site-specific DNA-methyltransferase [Anaerosacchariphilus sp. NSJ-68]|uniref:Site-specific DNA-methyltransferase n=2 Tax=Lachnospiraceae TaxID=186803 RepID=A0A923LET7_9FIRM|nr:MULTISPECIES: site-specific DNA-methyltransferase [Lachnospiraceae]MBC5660973.1 site-specific DNA-methyltransferase [Anaerosacchariphilus hominis]MBC5699630.1 site-specific DNA-methyltransferase [Roseburia difficilis]
MSTNISKQKREDLLNKIKEIRTFIASAPQDENTGNLLSYLSDLEKDVNGKKYGLVFEEHREEIDEVLDTHTPVLTEEKELFIDNGGQMNFLIEGDNLASLKLLQKTHKNSMDLIYIDPPYNTGNKDFIYDDCYVDSEDGFRHSKWISFMSKRLEIARTLLTERGVIFIQISDIELSQLRLMCDSVFGEENFLNVISVNMKNIAGASGGGEDKKFKKNCEYILVYAKNYSSLPLFNGPYEYREIYSVVEQYKSEGKNWHYTSVLVDRGEKEYIGSTVDGNGDEIKLFRRKNATVKSVRQVMIDKNISEQEVYYKYGQLIFEAKDAQSSIRTRVINAKKQYGISDDIVSIEYIPKTGKNKGRLYEQFYKGDKCRLFAWLGDICENIDGALYKKDLQGTYWDYTSRINNLTKEGNVEFGNGKKPIDLLKRIISLYPDDDITVLDFFAGSGSTGHAVISQNIEDEGNRQFILCTNNQNNICREKTYQRLSNVIRGYTTEKGKVFEAMPASLKYYKVDYVPISDRMYYEYADELLKHIRELVELENGVNFTGNAEIAIVLTEEELDDFISQLENNTKCQKLYLGNDILMDAQQAQAIKDRKITVNIIPDYYYKELEG